MKKNTVAIIVALCLLVAGVAIVAAAFTMTDFKFSGFSSEQYEEHTYTVDVDFEHILIATQEHDLKVLPSENGECRIVCDESGNFKLEYEIDSGALVVKVVDQREWYDYIGIFGDSAKLTLYLPKEHYTSITAATDTGDMTFSESLTFTRASIATSTGDINISSKVRESLELAASTGHINVFDQELTKLGVSVTTGKIWLENIKASGRITLECSTGDIELHSVEAGSISSEGSTGDILLKYVTVENDVKIERSTGDVTLTSVVAGSFDILTDTGDVKLYLSDAESIEIETDTGRVDGTLLTEKIFITESSTGKIKVPHTTSGGTCKIKTSTGDIHITID